MATTKIWAIKDSLSRVVGYANNPEKTEYEDVARVLHYADNPEKSVLEGEKFYLSSSINCRGDPLESMLKVQKHFNARGENLAYHAYQSFKPGEVTPELCHKIGVELAKKIWGSHYQVVIATHLNREYLHNHFVISAVSFRSGKKLDTGNNYWKRVLVPASDEICRAYGLSVVEKRKPSTPRKIQEAEKNGEPTRYNLMREALDNALKLATCQFDLVKYMRDQGYELSFKDRKKPKLRSIFSKKWVDLSTLGDKYTNEEFDIYCEYNLINGRDGYYKEQEHRQKRNGYYTPIHCKSPKSLEIFPQKLSTIGIVLEIFMAILGWLPEQKGEKYTPLSPEMKAEMRDARKKCEMYSRAAIVIGRENLTNATEALDYIERISARMDGLRKSRRPLYRKTSKTETPEKVAQIRAELARINDEILLLSSEKKALVNVLERSGMMKEMIQNEMQMRREARERNYMPLESEKKTSMTLEHSGVKEQLPHKTPSYGRVRSYRNDREER